MSNSKYILVTGGAGYIGSHTVVELISNGYEPIILDDFSNSNQKVIQGIEDITNTKVVLRKIDICNIEACRSVFQEFRFEGVIHFAAFKAVGESVSEPIKYYRNNLNGLLNVLELVKEFKVENLVFSSSCTVYGNPLDSKVVSEKTELQEPNSPYGNTKRVGERIISDFIQSNVNLKVLNLRYFNPVGAHVSSLIGELPLGKPNNLLPAVTQCAIGKLPSITIHGNDYKTIDGTCVRDYVHVVDVADAHVKGIEWLFDKTGSFEENINIGTGKGTSVLEIINTFEEVSGQLLNWSFGARREGDVEEIYANASKAFKVLNWKSKKTVKDAVSDAWNWELKLKNG